MANRRKVVPTNYWEASESIQKAMLAEILIGWGYEPVKPYYRQDANCEICASYGQTSHPRTTLYVNWGEPSASDMREFREQLDNYHQHVMCRRHLIQFYWEPAYLMEELDDQA